MKWWQFKRLLEEGWQFRRGGTTYWVMPQEDFSLPVERGMRGIVVAMVAGHQQGIGEHEVGILVPNGDLHPWEDIMQGFEERVATVVGQES